VKRAVVRMLTELSRIERLDADIVVELLEEGLADILLELLEVGNLSALDSLDLLYRIGFQLRTEHPAVGEMYVSLLHCRNF
jgi:hypothetical protein